MVSSHASQVRALRQRLHDLQRAGLTHLPRAEAPSVDPNAGISQRSTESGQPLTDCLSTTNGGSPIVSLTQKREQLQVLNEEVAPCTQCEILAQGRTQTVFGVGNPNAELCFIGEAPGRDEDKKGEPFVGRAGQLLDRIIVACNMTRDEVYICNILKCRPPDNRNPLPDEVAHCRTFLDRQLEIVKPRFICTLGGVASQTLLDVQQSMGKLRGQFYSYLNSQVMCTYHPAYLLRNPAAKAMVWEDMKMLMAAMGRPIEST